MQRDILRVVSRVPGADAAKRAADKVRATAARSSKKAAIGFLAVAGLAGLVWMTSPSSPTALAAAEIASAVAESATHGRGEPENADTTRTVLKVAEKIDKTPLVDVTETPKVPVTEGIVIRDAAAICRGYVHMGGAIVVPPIVFMFAILALMRGLAYVNGATDTGRLYRTAFSIVVIIAQGIAALKSREAKRALVVLLTLSCIFVNWSSVLGVTGAAGDTLQLTPAPDTEDLVGLVARHAGDMRGIASAIVTMGRGSLTGHVGAAGALTTSVSGYLMTIDVWQIAAQARDWVGRMPANITAAENATLVKDIVDEPPKTAGEAPVVDTSLANVIETRLNASGITGEVRSFLASVLTDQTGHNTTLARDIRAIAVGIASGSVPPTLSPDEIQRMSRHALEGGGGPFERPEFLGDTVLGNATWALVTTRIGTSRGNTSHYAYVSSDADRSIITLTPPVATARETVTLTLGGIIAASARPAPAGFALALNPGLGGLNSYDGRRGSSVIRLFDDAQSTDSLRAAGESALNLQSVLGLASAVAGLDCIYRDRVSDHAQNEPKESKAPNGGAEVSETFKTWATELGGLMSVRLVLTAHLSLLFGLPDPLGWLYKGKSESGAEMGRVGYVVFRLTRALTDLRGLTSGGATGESATPALMQVVALIQTVLPATNTSEQSDTSVALADTTVRSWTSLAHGVTGSPIFLWFLEGELDLLDKAMPEKGTTAALHHGAHGLVWHAASEARRVIDTLIYEDPTNNKRTWKNFPLDIRTVESQLGAVQARKHELGTSADSQWGRLEVDFAQAADALADDPTAATPEAPSASDADAPKKPDAKAEATKALAAKNRGTFEAVKTRLLGDVHNKKPTTNDMVRELILEVRFFTPDGDPFQSWQTHLGMWWNSGAVETPEFAEVAREALRGPHFQDANLPFTNDVIQILDDAASPVPTAADYRNIVSRWKTLTTAQVTPVAGAEDVAQLSKQLIDKLELALKQKTSEEEAAKTAKAATEQRQQRTTNSLNAIAKKFESKPKTAAHMLASIAKGGGKGNGHWQSRLRAWEDSGLFDISATLLGKIFREVAKLPPFQDGDNTGHVTRVIDELNKIPSDSAAGGTIEAMRSVVDALGSSATCAAPAAPAASAHSSESITAEAQACGATRKIVDMLNFAIDKQTSNAKGGSFGARRTRAREPRRFL